jgi:hypothetical protein
MQSEFRSVLYGGVAQNKSILSLNILDHGPNGFQLTRVLPLGRRFQLRRELSNCRRKSYDENNPAIIDFAYVNKFW